MNRAGDAVRRYLTHRLIGELGWQPAFNKFLTWVRLRVADIAIEVEGAIAIHSPSGEPH